MGASTQCHAAAQLTRRGTVVAGADPLGMTAVSLSACAVCAPSTHTLPYCWHMLLTA